MIARGFEELGGSRDSYGSAGSCDLREFRRTTLLVLVESRYDKSRPAIDTVLSSPLTVEDGSVSKAEGICTTYFSRRTCSTVLIPETRSML